MVIAAVGKLKPGAERELASRYTERANQLGRGLGIELATREVSESRAERPADRIAEEAATLSKQVGKGSINVALDETGTPISSAAFAVTIADWRDRSVAEICFLIGGADGLAEELRARSALVLSFGAMTWPHHLVRGMLGEQIYRALTILTGHPYHRG